MIEVRLFATFRENREKILHFEKEKFPTLLDILKELDIYKEEVAICLINGFHSGVEVDLNDNDVVSLFPPVGGG